MTEVPRPSGDITQQLNHIIRFVEKLRDEYGSKVDHKMEDFDLGEFYGILDTSNLALYRLSSHIRSVAFSLKREGK